MRWYHPQVAFMVGGTDYLIRTDTFHQPIRSGVMRNHATSDWLGVL